ncbi:hypothetical protein [Virgibacillus indicus]|nr:hypothetical protein [Virgibacillus indicus]
MYILIQLLLPMMIKNGMLLKYLIFRPLKYKYPIILYQLPFEKSRDN